MSMTPVAGPYVVLREEFDDWAILFNPDTAKAVGLNPTGVALWKMIDGSKSVTDLTAAFSKNYSGVPSTVGQEVAGFIEQLQRDGFVGQQI